MEKYIHWLISAFLSSGISAEIISTSYGSRSFIKARINSDDEKTKQKFVGQNLSQTNFYNICFNDDILIGVVIIIIIFI